MQAGAKEAGELAMRFAERNVASAFEFAEKLVRAKDPQEVAKLHADYARSQMEALSEQAKEMGQKAAKMGRHGITPARAAGKRRQPGPSGAGGRAECGILCSAIFLLQSHHGLCYREYAGA